MAERTFTDLELERFLANDLPAARASELEAKATAADRRRLDELRAEHQAFLAQIDVGAEVRAIGRRAARVTPEPRRLPAWWRWAMTGGALAAAAAALLIVVTRRADDPAREDDFQIKGEGISLIVHSQSRQLATGDAVRPGERIRFEIVATGRGFVTVVGVDGAGATTVYVPFGGSAPLAIDPAESRLLPGAIELDATPGAEKFYAFYAEQPFAIDAVVSSIRGGTLPAGVSSSEVVLHKRDP